MPSSLDPPNDSGSSRGAFQLARSAGADGHARDLFLRACKDYDLPRLALQAFLDGRNFDVIALVDRWRRTAQPTPQAFVLRAQASFRTGRREDAIEDLLLALKIDPTHRTANLRLFEWGGASQRERAAKALLGFDEGSLGRTLPCLLRDDVPGFGRLKLRAQRLTGWCVWRPGASVRLELRDASDILTEKRIAPDPSHRLAPIFGAAAEISSAFPFESAAAAFLLIEDRVVSQIGDHGGNLDDRGAGPRIDRHPQSVTIVVPVYDDLEATRSCLEALNAVLEATPDASVVVVDDASPNRAIKRYLYETFRGPRRMLVTNERNLGYLASVNRALRRIRAGDVILLNSDTVPPAALVDQMRAVARSDARIGTINPFSNNGEFVSFPKPFQDNTLDLDALPAMASCAAAANGGVAVDIPAGTGFCLYVTRACLEAVGALSTDYKRGYLEDADFGMRAREKGFRNVCATGIFVAHIGSRSFRGEKAPLVHRNNLTLERKFPSYFAESKAFVEADPLSAARARIEARLPLAKVRRLLIGPRIQILAIRECASRLRDAGIDVLTVVVAPRRSGWSAAFEASDGTVPQSLEVEDQPDAQAAFDLEHRLNTWRFDRVEIVDLFALPESLPRLVERLGIPVDLVAADARLGAGLGGWSNPEKRDESCEASIPSQPCANCRAQTSFHRMAFADYFMPRFLKRCRSVIFLDGLTREAWTAFSDQESRAWPTPVLRGPVSAGAETGLDSALRRRQTEAPNVGILLPYETTSALRLVFVLADALRLLNANIFLFGATSLDERLIGRGVFVCGKFALSERGAVLRQYQLDRLVSPYRSGFLWHLDAFRASTRIPAAYFGAPPASKLLGQTDLAIDPRVCDRRAAALFSNWLQGAAGKPSRTRSTAVPERSA